MIKHYAFRLIGWLLQPVERYVAARYPLPADSCWLHQSGATPEDYK